MNSVLFGQNTAVLDACVLAPMPVADLLLRLGEAGFYAPRWSTHILAELRKFLAGRGKTARQIEHRIEQMSIAFEDACISGYEDLIESVHLPDPNDRHVLAAAIRGQIQTIVTENLRDFPERATNPYGITVRRLDEFLVEQYDLDRKRFVEVLNGQALERAVDPQRLLEKINAPRLRAMIKPELV